MGTLRRTIATVGIGLALSDAALAAPPIPDDIAGPRVFDVRAFGASGDGLTDDTDALRRTLLAVPASGGTVLVPPGTYLVDPRGGTRAMNLLGAHTAIIGTRGASILKLADGRYAPHDGGMLLRNRDAVRGDADITVRGLTFDGNDRNNRDARGRAESLFRCTRCRDLLIEDCTFVDAKYHGIATILGSDILVRRNHFFRISQAEMVGDAVQLNGPERATIVDNLVENSDEGLFCQHENDPATPARDCVVERNQILNHPAGGACTGAGVPFACCSGRGTGHATCTPADPSGCFCAAGASAGSGIGVLAFGARVVDNVLIRVGQISVQGLLAAGGFPTRDVLIAKNRLLDLAWNDRLSGSGAIAIVAVDAPVSRVTVRDNHVDHTRDAGIRLASTSAPLSQIEVADNVVTASCTAQTLCGGIFLETTAATSAIVQVTIARNTVATSRAAGIRLEGPAADVHLIANSTGDGNVGESLVISTRHGPVHYQASANSQAGGSSARHGCGVARRHAAWTPYSQVPLRMPRRSSSCETPAGCAGSPCIALVPPLS